MDHKKRLVCYCEDVLHFLEFCKAGEASLQAMNFWGRVAVIDFIVGLRDQANDVMFRKISYVLFDPEGGGRMR
ncbi:unnamed protein product [Soboliphyme baturini]|uniref:Uncharacterized protein n=1 Tax=Soboliphyme baturini TaxID=241478 RepID=A0A183IZ68_9BILA|nr:unnamed protein product [Soboliphyme baturini]